jgi:hypothetical protein
VFVLALMVAVSASASYDRQHRVTHLRDALDAVQTSDAQTLARQVEYVAALERGACAAASARLRVECLIAAGQRYCRRHDARCALTMDIVVASALAEDQLVPPEARYQLMQKNKDYRQAVRREVQRLQGSLAVDYRLRMGEATDSFTQASHIDTYCRATADKSSLSWQTCAAELVWFIATASGSAAAP